MQLVRVRPLMVFVAQGFGHKIGMFSQAHIYFLQPQRIWYSVQLIQHHVRRVAPAQFHRELGCLCTTEELRSQAFLF